MTNDEGWRLEIPGLEELTTVGSKRCFGKLLMIILRTLETICHQYPHVLLSFSTNTQDLNEDTCLLAQLGSGPDATEQQYYT